ncbi:MAG TPA: proline-rich domain-containing protein, partial [Pirellulales bacterium]|nr:proline-rich domain-containing protein [Pirellulales bacterium]
MSVAQVPHGPELPEGLRDQLLGFRRRVWSIKTAEALAVATLGVLVAFLIVFTLDRFADTPASLRLAILAVALAVGGVVPFYAYRWIWRQRKLPQLARLLSRRHAQIGDQLLGIIELVESETEQVRSRALCDAAIRQVAGEAAQRDFRGAVPNPRHRRWACAAAVPSLVTIGLLVVAPAAAVNAALRFVAPWRDVPRYTFAVVEPVPQRLVVPHGEPFSLTTRLSESSRWRPAQAAARFGEQTPVAATLADGCYTFEVPAQVEPGWLSVRAGDSRQRVYIEPTHRPELSKLSAEVTLPEYLGRERPFESDARGGSLSVVKGSDVGFTATANRELAEATVNGEPRPTRGASLVAPPSRVDESRKMELRWRDELGLTGLAPFTLSIEGHDDEAPGIVCENLPRRKVVLDTESLNFTVRAVDDFGIKQVGMEWRGFDDEQAGVTPAKGERLLAAGDRERQRLEATGTFSAKALGIEPQAVEVRIFVEDYLPGRERVYTQTYTLYVLDPQQHALWLTEQLSKWQRNSLEVRDRELQLYETNKELRALAADELDRQDTRRRIENQAASERANGRRLSGLTAVGEDLVSQAARNPEFGPGHLEKWAEMLQVLKDISANRMPSVADLLKQASAAPSLASSSSKPVEPGDGEARAAANTSPNSPPTDDKSAAKPSDPAGPQVGQVRANPSSGSSPPPDGESPPKPPVPSIADIESTQQPPEPPGENQPPPSGAKGAPSLGLPQTTLVGGVKSNPNASCAAGQKLDEAVERQQDLLDEFAKVADELNRILANLEGSTFVKRLKGVARRETRVAGELGGRTWGVFGVAPHRIDAVQQEILKTLAGEQVHLTDSVGTIIDDMQAYYERRRMTKFKNVLDDMRKVEIVANLRQVGDDLPKEAGLSIAQCEYWSDTLDRWAEDLVDPASGGM